MSVRIVFITLTVCAAGLCSSAYSQYADKSVVVLAKDVVFSALPGDLPTAVLYGDPTKPGPFVTRVKLAPGTKILPHWNPDEQHMVTVLSGTLYHAVGEQWDESKFVACPPGTFLYEPPKAPHYAWAKNDEVILQISGIGPTGAVATKSAQQ